jgi:hypothetical protein
MEPAKTELVRNIDIAQSRQETAVMLTNMMFDASCPQERRQDALRIIAWLAGVRDDHQGGAKLDIVTDLDRK